jgi:2-oxoglutarate dehydrogenase E2 component (dihydrolipoamide succinyltransferase)
MEAVAQAIKQFPMINIALGGDRIIKRKKYQQGYGGLPDGNFLVR